MSWLRLRREVYRRDHGRCQVCLLRVGRLWDLGHLVDRCAGGQDLAENTVLMCVNCNRTRKPIHRTRDEALEWLREQQERARTGREVTADWRPFYDAMFRRTG
jgi:5-methylcytosine-specific restriction endonuclease McrA